MVSLVIEQLNIIRCTWRYDARCYEMVSEMLCNGAEAYEMVSLVIEQLNIIRSNHVDKFKAIFKKFEVMPNLSNVELALPRTVQLQTMRSSVECHFPKEYYKRFIFISFFDGFLQELQDLFQIRAKDCVIGMFLIPSRLQNFDAEANSVKSFHSSDYPCPGKFDGEV